MADNVMPEAVEQFEKIIQQVLENDNIPPLPEELKLDESGVAELCH